MATYNEIITEKLKSLGISEVGFSKTAEAAASYSDELPNAITLVVKLSDYVVDGIDNAPTYAYFQHYRAVNAFIDSAVLQTGFLIESLGYRYLPVAASQSIPSEKTPYSALVSHKAAARAANLGTIGKNALFLSYKYGARVRLGTILTDLPLECASGGEAQDVCGRCRQCIKSCPAMALTGRVCGGTISRDDIIDAGACSTYMKQQFQHIGRGAVCGICMRVCPYRGEKESGQK